MRFRNTAHHALDFTLHEKRYVVEIGGTCEIPDEFAYAAKHHGLPLVEAGASSHKAGKGADKPAAHAPSPAPPEGHPTPPSTPPPAYHAAPADASYPKDDGLEFERTERAPKKR